MYSHVQGSSVPERFSRISEIRALAPDKTNIIALTATATYDTRSKIIKTLEMDDCKVIAKTPNNVNIYYAVLPLPTSPCNDSPESSDRGDMFRRNKGKANNCVLSIV